jgi:hypothetical protein
MEKLEEKRQLERPSFRLDDNNKIYYKKVGLRDRDRINLAKYKDRFLAFVNMVIKLRVS